MTRVRKELISVEDTPFYHCIYRCVRRAYLCGDHHHTQQNFDHRKDWLVEKIKFPASVYAIDIYAYAVMFNHYHLVLFIHQEAAKAWTQADVIERWGKLFPSSAKNIQNLINASKSKFARQTYETKKEEWRRKLFFWCDCY